MIRKFISAPTAGASRSPSTRIPFLSEARINPGIDRVGGAELHLM